jgi:hypothetical protein
MAELSDEESLQEPLRDCFLDLAMRLKVLCGEWEVGPSSSLWSAIEPAITSTEISQLEELAQKLIESSPNLVLKSLLSWIIEQVPLLKYAISVSLRDLTPEESDQLKVLQDSLVLALQQQRDIALDNLDLLLESQKESENEKSEEGSEDWSDVGSDFHSVDEEKEEVEGEEKVVEGEV